MELGLGASSPEQIRPVAADAKTQEYRANVEGILKQGMEGMQGVSLSAFRLAHGCRGSRSSPLHVEPHVEPPLDTLSRLAVGFPRPLSVIPRATRHPRASWVTR